MYVDFWIVGADKIDGGTMLVSNINRSAVYKVFGIRNSLFHMVDPTYGMRPVLMKLTMIPWYGRLVYDGVVMPSKNGESPDIADDELAKKLRKNVKLAKLEKRVVEKLAELECLDAEGSVPMPSTSGDRIDEGSQLISKTTKEPTPLEKELLEKLAKCQISDDMESAWCMRRMGYTGLENPSHRGMIITGNGAPLVSFTCRALVPEPADIFVALMDGSSAVDGKLPAVVLVDDLKCSKRVEYLLRQHTEVDNALHQIKVYYYPPPTSEETAAALLQK
mgnify:CR=1 FL=1